MPMETPAFTREDIYSYLSRRVHQFLKGGSRCPPAQRCIALERGLTTACRLVSLLQRLAERRRVLYGWARTASPANTKFKVELFSRVLQDASHVTSQSDAAIVLRAAVPLMAWYRASLSIGAGTALLGFSLAEHMLKETCRE